ncbi:hypothetical protein NLI96_g206 [Meripilus lineatus]|uniref:GCN5-related N-acetyltransferase Rv2170-like domain-containing protein n=1 Tax=Meripilus lineatus TaxID=2056292 RepID=A0AAD5VCZ5_9APHY|nr:hypothetical protein NLI96_g206 [Physisporinus lineatus]
MSRGTFLKRVDLSSTESVTQLDKILQPHLPFSLPLLGSLHSTHDNLASAKTVDPSLHVWASFNLPCSPAEVPRLFSVIAYSPIYAEQFRLFCTADSSPEVASPNEERHVAQVVRTFVDAVAHSHEIVEGLDIEAMLKTPIEGSPAGIHFGSVHSKWVPCLRPYTVGSINCCLKFFREPRVAAEVMQWDASEDDWNITQLREEDIELVRDNASFPRTYEFVDSRRPWSVSIRRSEGEKAIAWQIMVPDGSMGMLHVSPEYRRTGLARRCISALSRKLEQMFVTEDEGKRGDYPFARWEYQDVVQGNEKSVRLITSMDGWSAENRWDCYWMYLVVERHDQIIPTLE